MYGTLWVDFGDVGTRCVSVLGAEEDVEIVVCGVASRVAFCADCGAEDYEVFCYAYGGREGERLAELGLLYA